MKAPLIGLGALLLAVAAASTAQAHPFHYLFHHRTCPDGPNAFGWDNGYSGDESMSAPVWTPPCLPPAPFQPNLNALQQERGTGFPVHPFARSPRDYFMTDP